MTVWLGAVGTYRRAGFVCPVRARFRCPNRSIRPRARSTAPATANTASTSRYHHGACPSSAHPEAAATTAALHHNARFHQPNTEPPSCTDPDDRALYAAPQPPERPAQRTDRPRP
ncbi:hypothetical protein GCM10010195_74170 [Kitasatospora griseola]|nr:hypothetical protein GCM10010195_74170 [Kitasatospora griseola]